MDSENDPQYRRSKIVMIRRDDENDWLLILQSEHANLAAEVAAAWGNETIPPPAMRESLVPAIRHHDDGWREWERMPQVDPRSGRPRDFTEMPMADSTQIWSNSITICGYADPLAGIWVSNHFCWLATQARKSRQDSADELSHIQRFLDEQQKRQHQCRTAYSGAEGLEDFEDRITTGFLSVQLFDRLSLWICCRERSEPQEFTDLSAGRSFRLIPKAHGEFSVEPFPFSVGRLELFVTARRIPARTYADDADLQMTLFDAPAEQIRWTLSPA